MVHFAIASLSKVLCFTMVSFQGIMMDAYLSKLYNPMWWCWAIADAFVLFVWIFLLIIARKQFVKQVKTTNLDSEDDPMEERHPDEIRYAYIAWVFYVAFLCPKVVLLFKDVVKTLDEKDILGPNFLRMSVSCTPLIFLLLVYGFRKPRPHSSVQLSVTTIAAAGALDLFDSVDLLDYLFIPKSEVTFPVEYNNVTIGFTCATFFMPVLSLYALSIKSSSGLVFPLLFKTLNITFNLFILNIPNMVIRSILWHSYNLDVSVLLMKNILCILVGFYELLEYHFEHRPVSCKVCGNWVQIHCYHQHKNTCVLEDVPLEVIENPATLQA